MSDQHCPGFESNKSLSEVVLRCPDCGMEQEVFSDELDKKIKCSGCGTLLDPAQCKID